jgi:hypothetical protein
MRAFCLIVMGCGLAWAQSTSTYVVDGQRVETGKSDGITYSVESARSLNGRTSPLERVEERVVESSATGSVVERVIRRYDPNGNLAQTEKVRIEERKNSDGSTSTETVTWRGDVNGRLEVAERVRGTTVPSEGGTRSELTVERPTLNGGFETLEKRSISERKSGATTQQETVTLRRDAAGRFSEALRQVKERTEQDGLVTENSAQYEPGTTGRMQLASQSVSRSVKNADGSQRTEVDLFRVEAPGRPTSSRPQLIEQQVIERRPSASGAVESLSVRRPPLDGGRPSGSFQKVAERVCTGTCK